MHMCSADVHSGQIATHHHIRGRMRLARVSGYPRRAWKGLWSELLSSQTPSHGEIDRRCAMCGRISRLVEIDQGVQCVAQRDATQSPGWDRGVIGGHREREVGRESRELRCWGSSSFGAERPVAFPIRQYEMPQKRSDWLLNTGSRDTASRDALHCMDGQTTSTSSLVCETDSQCKSRSSIIPRKRRLPKYPRPPHHRRARPNTSSNLVNTTYQHYPPRRSRPRAQAAAPSTRSRDSRYTRPTIALAISRRATTDVTNTRTALCAAWQCRQ
jgi:hypothetical protein